MSISINDVLSSTILDTYKLVAGKGNLNRVVESISLLETPDFEKYVKEKTLILTTLYPIQTNLSLFKKLIHVLSDRQSAGIIIKLKRYIDVIPFEVIQLCDTVKLPMITIDYDANLSDISTRILNEITNQSLKTLSLSSFYLDLVKTLDEKPKLENILTFKDRLESMDYWIYSHQQEKVVSTNPKINQIASEIASQPTAFQKIDSYFIYADEVKLSNQLLYQVVFFAKEDNRSKMYYYAEIIKLMLVFIYQKRQENTLQQNQFLVDLVTSTNVIYSDNQALKDKAETYNWTISFPLQMILFQGLPTRNILSTTELRDILLQVFKLNKEVIRFVTINQRLLFIFHNPHQDELEIKLRKLIEDLEKTYKIHDIKAAYATHIKDVQSIASDYATLSRGLNFMSQRKVKEKILNNHSVKMFSMLGKISEAELKDYVTLVLGPILDYEAKHGGNLLETLNMLINQQFNLKKTAESLFIHYNTLRHRLQVLEMLGYGKNKLETTHYDLIFAVYFAKNLL